MLIGILSDTHDQLARTKVAVAMLRNAGAEVLIHCGDLMGPEIVGACGGQPAYFVFGNNDDDLPALQKAMDQVGAICLGWAGEVSLANNRIAVAHGHVHADVTRLLATEPDYLLTGHSHVPADWRSGPTRCINPGALARAAQFTVVLLDLGTDELRFLTVPR
jgi:putative phosphoesterase